MNYTKLKGKYNNQKISLNGKELGVVKGIELDFDTVCFTFEDNSKKYINIDNLNQITTDTATYNFERVYHINNDYRISMDFNGDGIIVVPKVENKKLTTSSSLNGSEERIKEFKQAEKLYFSNPRNYGSTFSKDFILENGTIMRWTRESDIRVHIVTITRFSQRFEDIIKLPKL